MPNITRSHSKSRIMGSMDDARAYYVDRLIMYVPVNDESCVTFVADYLPLTGELAELYRGTRKAAEVPPERLQEIAEKVLAGKMRLEQMPEDLSLYHTFWIEDYVTQLGQGRIADRSNEHLARIDQAVSLVRRLWRRELKALEEGRPQKQWTSPAGIMRS
jgi:5,5'-dehydrodivanillate O-demethylase